MFFLTNFFAQIHSADEGINKRIDSLKLRIGIEKENNAIYDVLVEIGRSYDGISPDSALKYFNQAKKKAEEMNDELRLSHVGALVSGAYIDIGKTKEAILMLRQLKTKLAATSLAQMSSNHKSTYAQVLGNLANAYQTQGDYPNAITIYFETLKVIEQMKDDEMLALCWNNMGMVFQALGDYEKALNYFSKGLDLGKKLNDSRLISMNLTNIGVVYIEMERSEEALAIFEEALLIDKRNNDQEGIARIKGNIGLVHQRNGEAILKRNANIDKGRKEVKIAIECYKNSLTTSETLNSEYVTTILYGNIGWSYILLNDRKNAEYYLKKSLELSTSIHSLDDIKNAHENLFVLYKKNNDFVNSLFHYEKYILFRDSILNEENTKINMRQELKYEYEKQAAADSVAHAKESEIKNAELAKQKAEISAKKNQQYALFGGLLCVCVFGVFMYNRFKVTQKQKGIIEEQKNVVEEQKKLVEEKQKEILDSIHYARRIQMAQVPSEKRVSSILKKLRS